MAKDAAYWREYRARKSGRVAQPQPHPQPKVAQPVQLGSSALSTSSPARVASCPPGRGGNVLPEPRQRHVPLGPPAPRDAYERAKVMLADGETFGAVRRALGVSWLELDEAARAYDDNSSWQDAKDRHKLAVAARIASAAAEAGIDGVKRKVVTKEVGGVVTERTETEEHGADASLMRVGLEATDPERFGKLAKAGEGGKGASVNMQVVGTVILARPEPLNED